MRYLFTLIFMAGFSCFAQGYKAEIAAHRKQYMADFLEDKSSPLKKEDLQFLRFYDADSSYKVKANVQLIISPQSFIMHALSGNSGNYVKYAILNMVLKGKAIELTAYKNIAFDKIPSLKDYIFLPFTDDTNGKQTYGGGRYIDLRENEFKNNQVIIDFNKAYNPYCAFGGNYVCPKPPDENQLHLAVEAGEKKYAGKTIH